MNKPDKRPTRYAVFAWEVKQPSQSGGMFSLFIEPPKEKWEAEEEGKKYLAFVEFVSSPKDVIEVVRKDPTKKYVLMTGTIEALHIPVSVFVGGKNLATLDHEWREEP